MEIVALLETSVAGGVREGRHHEQGEVDAARDVALEDRVADVPAPDGKTLALALFEVAPAHDGPARVAGEDPVARLYLVVEIREASEPREWTADLHERLELPRVHVLPVAGDVPAAREHETRPRRRVVEHCLGRSSGVLVDTARDEHDEHPVAPSDGAPDDVGVVRGSGDDRDTPLELVELPDALLSAHADHLVPPTERVLHHVPPELPGSADDADPHRARPIACQRIAGSITGLRR